VVWAAVPEAAVDEDGNPSRGEHNVRPTPHSSQHSMINSIPQAERVEFPTQRQLRRSVSHALAAETLPYMSGERGRQLR